MTSRVFDN
jgi:hypothetical protein